VIAPRLARDGGVAGIIVAEAVGRDWPEYEIRNLRRDLELDGSSAAAIDAALIEKASCMQMYMVEGLSESAIEAATTSCKTHDSVYPVSQAYIGEVAQLNVIEPWMKLGLPVLAIYGASDFETEIADHQRIVDVVNAGRPGSATLVTIDGMSHLLGKAATPAAAYADYGKRVEEYDSQLSGAVVAWLRGWAGIPTP
jgi:alpha-beta hydrolase superfamily lysophospholipase